MVSLGLDFTLSQAALQNKENLYLCNHSLHIRWLIKRASSEKTRASQYWWSTVGALYRKLNVKQSDSIQDSGSVSKKRNPFLLHRSNHYFKWKNNCQLQNNGWNSTKPRSNIQIWVTNYISRYTATLCLLSGLIQHFELKSLPPYLPYLPHVHSRRQCIVYLVCNINSNQLLFSWAYQLNSHLYTTTYIKIEN